MATAPSRTGDEGFQKWKDGIDRANGDWDYYDAEIRRVVSEYNMHLRIAPHFHLLDWRLVKAMLWTESGPHRDEWKTKPLQIGVPRDPGLDALLYGEEGSELIVPPCYVLWADGVRTNPKQNIVAAVGYMLMRMADYGFATVLDRDSGVFNVTVGRGDSLSTLARKHRSTLDTMQKLNPGAHMVREGQVLKCQKASIQKVIVGFRPFTLTTIARRYNGNGQPTGDPLYSAKLEYSMNAIKRRNPR